MLPVLFIFDLHTRYAVDKDAITDPHFVACEHFVDWFGQTFRTPQVTIFLGDVFDRPKENGWVNGLVAKLMGLAKALGPVIVLTGNHDYSRREGSALNMLKGLGGINVIDIPQLLDVQGLTVLFLPYLYPKTTLFKDTPGEYFVPTMNDFYSSREKVEQVVPDLFNVEPDLLLGHVGDETSGKFAQDCDLSWFNGKRLLGHIHHRVNKSFGGSTLITRRDEAGKDSVMIRYEEGEYAEVRVPKFLDYVKISYGQPPKPCEGVTVWINDIVDCPDVKLAREEYLKQYGATHFIENFSKKEIVEADHIVLADGETTQGKTSRQHLTEFINNKKPSDRVSAILQRALNDGKKNDTEVTP